MSSEVLLPWGDSWRRSGSGKEPVAIEVMEPEVGQVEWTPAAGVRTRWLKGLCDFSKASITATFGRYVLRGFDSCSVESTTSVGEGVRRDPREGFGLGRARRLGSGRRRRPSSVKQSARTHTTACAQAPSESDCCRSSS
jgi:hypothetical protein